MRAQSLIGLSVIGLALACGKPQIVPRTAPGVVLASITVTSPSFPEGGRIPVDCTCDGTEIMPEIVISSPPENTKSLLVLVEDPDAASGVFTHMVAFNLAPELRKLPAGQELTNVGEGARWGLNDFSVAHYSGPCPPKGEAHRYRWRVIALDTMLKLSEGSPLSQVNEAIDGHIIGEGSLTGQFGH
ncbi:MAG: YbhB/YbcL family Raf kinase inhibitor-like protein [Labilithrix sp.]